MLSMSLNGSGVPLSSPSPSPTGALDAMLEIKLLSSLGVLLRVPLSMLFALLSACLVPPTRAPCVKSVSSLVGVSKASKMPCAPLSALLTSARGSMPAVGSPVRSHSSRSSSSLSPFLWITESAHSDEGERWKSLVVLWT